MMRQNALSLLLLLLPVATNAVEKAPTIDEDGVCSIVTVVPFTNNERASEGFVADALGIDEADRVNPGFSQMAAALLALEMFNNRDHSVVPELNYWAASCTVMLEHHNVAATHIDRDENTTEVNDVSETADEVSTDSESSNNTTESSNNTTLDEGSDEGIESGTDSDTPWGVADNPFTSKSGYKTASAAFHADHPDAPALIVDSQTEGHMASRTLLSLYEQTGRAPCAVAGPYSDTPALELSALATAGEFPLVAHRQFNQRIVMDEYNPFSSSVFPDMADAVDTLISFLHSKGRDNYISYMYGLSDENIQRREELATIFGEKDMVWDSFPFKLVDELEALTLSASETKPVRQALQLIKARGFKTVVVSLENAVEDFYEIARNAHELGMTDGDYFWVWFTSFDPIHLHSEEESAKALLSGSALILPLANYQHVDRPEKDAFLAAWRSQGPDFVDRVNAANPIKPGEVGYYHAEPDFFQRYTPDYGAGFLYDSIMSIGVGACIAQKQKKHMLQRDLANRFDLGSLTDTTDETDATEGGEVVTPLGLPLTGKEHLKALRNVDFQGATGQVKFSNGNNGRPGARRGTTLTWGAFNLLPKLPDDKTPVAFQLTDIQRQGTGTGWDNVRVGWDKINDFVFADGTLSPPKLLRNEPEKNYLPQDMRALGIALASFVYVVAFFFIVWTFTHRTHSVVETANPIYLYILCIGCIMYATAIITISYDEGSGKTTSDLNSNCQAVPWLLYFGHSIVYGALFMKLWSMNENITLFAQKFKVRKLASVFAGSIFCTFIVLITWSAADPLKWKRFEVNDITGESVGHCYSENQTIFQALVISFMFVPTCLAAILAWKSRSATETDYEVDAVWYLIITELTFLLVIMPSIALLQDVDSVTGRYLGFVFMFWIFPVITLFTIFLPKFLTYRINPLSAPQTDEEAAAETAAAVEEARAEQAKAKAEAKKAKDKKKKDKKGKK